MPATKTYTTPGVYVAEKSAFPPSVVAAQTAVPAFIGYTQKATISGKPVLYQPVAITSLAEFEQIFGVGDPPLYKIVTTTDTSNYDFRVRKFGTDDYDYYDLKSLRPGFQLYNSMRLFYANGGGDCYVVSVGGYGDEVSASDLEAGLDAISEQVGPTMLVVPDAVALPGETEKPWISKDGAFGSICHKMLVQAVDLQDRVAILDVYGTQYLSQRAGAATEPKLGTLVDEFRTGVGDQGLSYGMAYFPFLNSTVVASSSVTYKAVDDSEDDRVKLEDVLTEENKNLYGDPEHPDDPTPRQDAVQEDIDSIPEATDVRSLNDDLTAALPLLVDIERMIAAKQGLVPPSAAMAGIMTRVDATRGVWNAPANVTLSKVASPSFLINSDQQGDLNVPVNGKAIDALREFPGRGTVVWGARTLDGNSPDYRYIQVRRTLIYIQQSIKTALDKFVFAPNNGQTWTTVVSSISGFLQTVWSQGGLMGATASEAFSVECGLGSTMTGQDILDGYMIVQVTLQLNRPAEFIELTFTQKMEGVA